MLPIWLVAAAVSAQVAPDSAPTEYEEVTIIGSRERQAETPGSATVIGSEELQQFVYADIQRIARQVPGLAIQVEDGYGLRPNISIRGVATERSGRITLLEDNVLIAPAPYSAPSAYYFPTPGRMSAVEVLKGPAAIQQGPYTIGGALNLVSTPLPAANGGELLLEGGSDATARLHGHYGWVTERGFGGLIETHQWESDGFQDIDRSSVDAGLDVSDYTVKLRYAPPGSRHDIELKLQYADQTSNQSYLGLTDADFTADPNRRYGLSALDRIDTEHEQTILRYGFDYSDRARFTATIYNNEHQRDWFKTEGVDLNGSESAERFERTSWASVVQAVNRGETLDGYSALDLQRILDGDLDTAPGSIQIRSNAREYYSRGVQATLNWDLDHGGVDHAIEAGIRYHEDQEDRLQRNSSYRQVSGGLQLDDRGLLGNAGNRIQNAQAWALHVTDTITLGRWQLSPGFRYERIDQDRVRYETRDGRTSDPSARTADNVRDTRANQTDVFLPGMGVVYELTDAWSLIGGVHRGFTAPTNAPGVREETATNYEIGIRRRGHAFNLDAFAFLSDYDNLLGVCTASSGADCEIGDAFNGDAATVRGLEVSVQAILAAGPGWSVPLRLTYSYLDGEFDSDIADTDFFGDVSAGDPIPYIPEHQASLQVGYESGPWDVYASVNYVDETCVRAACEAFERTDDSLAVDLVGHYWWRDDLGLFARIENLSDDRAIVGRQPYGARPNRDRTATLGLRWRF